MINFILMTLEIALGIILGGIGLTLLSMVFMNSKLYTKMISNYVKNINQ